MLMDMLIIFIMISIILFIITILIMEDYPMVAIPLIFAGMIFTVLCTYGFFNVEIFFMGQNLTTGNLAPYLYVDTSYTETCPWVFFFLFILYIFLFIRIGFNLVKDSLDQRGGNRR